MAYFPITNGADFTRCFGFAVPLTGITGIVRCDHSRVFDTSGRNGRKVDTFPADAMVEIFARVSALFG